MLGQEVEDYIANQFNIRQNLYSNTDTRNNNQIQLLNNQSAWIKMASGVSLETDESGNLSPFAKEKLQNIEIPDGSLENLKGVELAKKFVLFNGVSSLSNGGSWSGLKNKNGFGTSNFLNSNGSYSKSDFGYVPMPGITGFDMKSLNRGSIKKATIKFKLHSKSQFDIFELLYLRLGYTVLIEFGNNIYADSNDLTSQEIGQTLIEDEEEGFFSNKFSQGGSYIDVLNKIEKLRGDYNGNYGGFLGKIVNFEWGIDNLGSYDVTLNLISLGDVVESLKINLSPNKQLSNFIVANSPPSDDPLPEDGSPKDQISTMLYIYRFINNGNKAIDRNNDVVYFESTNTQNQKTIQSVGYLMATKPIDDLSVTTETFELILGPTKFSYPLKTKQNKIISKTFPAEKYNITIPSPLKDNFDSYKSFIKKKGEFERLSKEKYIKKTFNTVSDIGIIYSTTGRTSRIDEMGSLKSFRKKIKTTLNMVEDTTVIQNPLQNFSILDGFKTTQSTPTAYIRLGALLTYIKNNIIPTIIKKSKDGFIETVKGIPIIKLDDYSSPDQNTSYYRDSMFTLPNQLSLDPKVCIIKNQILRKHPKVGAQTGDDNSQVNYKNVMFYDKLLPFRELDLTEEEKEEYGIGDTHQLNPHRAYIKNIYLNHSFLEEVLSNKVDDKGDISLYEFLSEICTRINKALGGINNLEPIIDETENELYIGDSTSIPNQINLTPTIPYTLNLFGFDLTGKGNFIRKLDIKTTISPEYASMITIGSTSAGYVKGTNGTAFSKWNKGLSDRFKPNLSNPKDTTASLSFENQIRSQAGLPITTPPSIPEPLEQYINNYLSKLNQYTAGYGKDPNSDSVLEGAYNQKQIDQNLSAVTEFYKYAQSMKTVENMGSNDVIGGIGFIPFKMSFTMNGIEGIKIYNTLHVNSSFLPQAYGKTLDFIITGVDHSIKNNDWETTISTLVQPKSANVDGLISIENYGYLFTDEVKKAIATSNPSTSTKAKNKPNTPGQTTSERNPEKAKGTTGTIGPTNDRSKLSPGALTTSEINKTIKDSGGKTSLRKRIVGIAASYVGQSELPGNNQGWHDQRFQDKMKKPNVTDKGWGWYAPHPWCAWFVSRVMYEAHVVGNSILGPADSKSKSIWKNRYKEGANVKPFSAGVAATEAYFRDTLKRDVRRAKAIKNPDLIQPGDIVYYNISHIGIVVKINKDSKGKLKSLDVVNGNTSAKATTTQELRDGGTTALKRNLSVQSIRGFSRLFES